MGKHLDKLGKIEDFQAPWESETGADAEIDSAKLKKYLFNLLTDKAKAEDAAEEANGKVAEAEKAVEDAKTEFAKGDTTGKIAELEGKLSKAQEEAKTAQGNLLRLEVATEKGLTPQQAKRLQGETKEDLEADADEILETFGIKQPAQQDDNEQDDDDDEVRTTPRPRLRLTNPGDDGGDSGQIDFEKAADDILGTRVL